MLPPKLSFETWSDYRHYLLDQAVIHRGTINTLKWVAQKSPSSRQSVLPLIAVEKYELNQTMRGVRDALANQKSK